MRAPSALLCAFSILAVPAVAQTSSSPAGPEEEIKVVGKKTCRMETRIGSMMPRRVCRTASETKMEERAKEEGLARLYEQDRLRKQHMVCKEMGMRC